MENKVLQKNLEAISRYDKKLANDILMFSTQKANFSLCQTNKGEYNIVFKNEPIHSMDGAIDEVNKIISTIEDVPNSIRIVYGLGLGYLADAMSNKLTKSTIIVYEPEIEILFYVLQLAQIDALYKNNVILCNDKKIFRQHIEKNANDASKITVSFLNYHKKHYENDINTILRTAQKEQGQISANINTLIKKAPLGIENTFKNLENLTNCILISDVLDVYKDKAALIVSAGPSLKENVEIIKENKDKFVIFCVNNALRLLDKTGITPDFVVDIETQNGKSQYEGIDLTNTYMILEIYADYDKFKIKSKGKIAYISKNGFLNKWIRKCLNITQDIETCGTVSHAALYSAYLMGFKKLILIGQDLAYKNGDCYAAGSQFDDLKCVFNEEKKNYEIKVDDIEKYSLKRAGAVTNATIEASKRYIQFLNNTLYTLKGQDGSMLPTQAGYAFFVEIFEKCALEFKNNKPDIELINSSIGGAQIDGFDNIPLSNVVKDLENVEKINLNMDLSINYNAFSNDIPEIKDDLNKYYELTQDALILAKKIVQELKIKKIVTSNNLKNINKHNELLSKIIGFANDKIWNPISAQYSLQLLPLIEKADIENLNNHIEMYENICKIYLWISFTTDRLLKILAKC